MRGDRAAEIRNGPADLHQVAVPEGNAVIEGGKANDPRGGWNVGVVQREHRSSPAEQPAGFEPNPSAAPGHLHAAGVGFEQLAVHHLGDQLGPVQPGPVIRVGDAFRKDASPELEQGAVRQLDGLQAARAQLAADRATEVDLHGRSTLATGFPFGRQSPTISNTRPSTGSKGRMMPPRSALSQRGRNRRMAGLSAIAARRAGGFRRHGVRRLVFNIDAVLIVSVAAVAAGFVLATPRRSLGREGADVEPLAEEMNALQVGEALDQPADPVVDRKPGFVRRWVAMAPAPSTDGFLEGRGKTPFSAALHPRVSRHGLDSKSRSANLEVANRDNAEMRLSEIMAMANRLAGCVDTPPDSQVYLDGEVRRVFVGIDVDVSELLLARTLGADGIIAHHPIGSRARLGLPAVIERHEAQMRVAGVPEPIAHEMMLARQRPIAHGLHTTNYDRVVDAARQLEMPMMNIHLAADIIGRQFFIEFVNRVVDGQATTVGSLVAELRTIPEMEASLVQPELWLGTPENRVGRWVVQMAAGTNGGAPVYRTYYEHGFDTILAMHIDERDLRELEQLQRPGANLVITGHMPSDSIGINRVIDALEQQGVEVIAGSGVIRV